MWIDSESPYSLSDQLYPASEHLLLMQQTETTVSCVMFENTVTIFSVRDVLEDWEHGIVTLAAEQQTLFLLEKPFGETARLVSWSVNPNVLCSALKVNTL